MINATTTASSCCHYELKIEIAASPDRVWNAMIVDTNAWWLPDFRVAGADSIITFDPVVGGRGLVEENPAGDSLLWYSVHMHLPTARKIYLIGHIAAEWGGPSTSSLRLAVEAKKSGSTLTVSDARHGNVDERQVQSYVDGWKQLFTNGLKAYVEQETS